MVVVLVVVKAVVVVVVVVVAAAAAADYCSWFAPTRPQCSTFYWYMYMYSIYTG